MDTGLPEVPVLETYVNQTGAGGTAFRLLLRFLLTHLYVIPLYSKMMLSKRKYHRKHSWWVSFSRLESQSLRDFGRDSMEAIVIRILKILRDGHLTYSQWKTKRQFQDWSFGFSLSILESMCDQFGADMMTFVLEKISPEDHRNGRELNPHDGEVPVASAGAAPSPSTRSRLPDIISTGEEEILIGQILVATSDARSGSDLSQSDNIQSDVGSESDISSPSNVSTEGDVSSQSDVRSQGEVSIEGDVSSQSDVTAEGDVSSQSGAKCVQLAEDKSLKKSDTEAAATSALLSRFQRSLYQSKDIGSVKAPDPDTGEYWGPRQYVGSVEIKTWMLARVIKLCRLRGPAHTVVLEALLEFRDNIQRLRSPICSLFTGEPVCTPLKPQVANEAETKITQLIQDMLHIAAGRDQDNIGD